MLDLGARPEVQRLFQLTSALIKMFCKHRVVKPDQDRLADFQGWGSKVAGWAEHGSLGLITQALFKIEGFHFFTFHGNQR